MKKFILMCSVIALVFVVIPKTGKSQLSSLLETAKTIVSKASKITEAGTTVGNVKKLIVETQDTYSAIEELYCLKRDLKFKIDFAKDNMRTCYFNIKYNNYITSYNSLVSKLEIMIGNLKSMVMAIQNVLDDGGGATDVQNSINSAIDLLNTIQKSVREITNTMLKLDNHIDKKVAERIRMDMMMDYEASFGKYELILE